MRCLALFATLLGTLHAMPAHAEHRVDDKGRADRIAVGEGWMDLRGEVKMPSAGWKTTYSLADARNLKRATVQDVRKWTGTLGDGVASAVFIDQDVFERDGKLVVHIRATASEDSAIQGIVYSLDLPAADFAGGGYRANNLRYSLPKELPEQFRLWNGFVHRLAFIRTGTASELTIETDRRVPMMIQDGRNWKSTNFNTMIYVHEGPLAKGETAELELNISGSGQLDETPAELTLDAETTRYTLNGLGGNYCFGIEHPVTRYTITHLRPAWVRTEMSMTEWEPRNDNEDPEKADMAFFAERDTETSRLRKEFLLMREFKQKKLPLIVSIWALPVWMYDKIPVEKDQGHGNVVPREKWPELIESLGAYLSYARSKYQAEPDLFSFNEPDAGIRVKFTAEEHRDFIKLCGAYFVKLGLTTKMLLGDVANPRGTHTYCAPTVADAEAMKYVGAVSFHSWHGATPEQYAAWSDLAETAKRPLIVAEAGPDAGAWQTQRFKQFAYFVEEAAHYQEILQHARPQAILFWEYTNDYSLLETDPKDNAKLTITPRFCLQKHFNDFIPAGSEALVSASSQPSIRFTGFRKKTAKDAFDYSLHVSNSGWTRRVNISGIPKWITMLKAVRTDRDELFKQVEPVPVANGVASFEIPGQSFVTLTTMPIFDALGWVPLDGELAIRLSLSKPRYAFGEDIVVKSEVKNISTVATNWTVNFNQTVDCWLSIQDDAGREEDGFKEIPGGSIEAILNPAEIYTRQNAIQKGTFPIAPKHTGRYRLICKFAGRELTRLDFEVHGEEQK